VEPHGGERATVRGCRVVTTSMTARLLLANQLRSLPEISWTVVSGDEFADAPDTVAVTVVPMRREFAASDAVAVVRLWRCLRRMRFDFVQTHTPKASFLGLPAARLTGTPALYTMHGSLYFRDNGRAANVLGWMFEKWCCTWAQLVLVQSREDLDMLPEAHVCRSGKLRYVGNGVQQERFLEARPAAIDSPEPVVLMVARLVREKGCADFIDVARELGSRARFVHVGPVEPDQKDALTSEEVADARAYVSFVGAVDDIRPYLASADIVLLPSYREGIPRVPMEAAGAGVPVVGYDVRGMREVVDPSTGVLVARGDVAALIDAVDALLRDAGRRRRLGAAGRRKFVEQFSEDDVIQRLREVYAEVTCRETPPLSAPPAGGRDRSPGVPGTTPSSPPRHPR